LHDSKKSSTFARYFGKVGKFHYIMTAEEKQQYQADLLRGLELAEYRMLRDKAMHNETIIQGDEENGWREGSAREVFVKLYNEPVPTF
jgi:hypothetical protein